MKRRKSERKDLKENGDKRKQKRNGGMGQQKTQYERMIKRQKWTGNKNTV